MCDVEDAWADFELSREPQPITVQLNNVYFCQCGGTKVTCSNNVPVCSSCGIVELYVIDDSAEWTSGVSESGVANDPSRCNLPVDNELFSEQWGSGSQIHVKGATYEIKRMAKINFHSSMNHKDRSLFHAYKDIERAALSNLNLSAIAVRDAKVMYKKFNTEKLTRGAIRNGIKANCVLAACKLANLSRTTKEVADAFGIPSKDISRTAQLFRDTILGQSPPKVTSVGDIACRMLNDFEMEYKLKNKVRVKCRNLSDELSSCVSLMGKTPTCIAAVVILITTDLPKQDICKLCKVSLPTMNKIEVLVKEHLETSHPN
jgi:transcription initiation factor TFIIB